MQRASVAALWAALALVAGLQVALASYEIAPGSCTPNGKVYATACGASSAISTNGITFEPNAYVQDGPKYWSTPASITNAGPYENVFKNECVKNRFKISVPVSGDVKVTVLNAEIWFVNRTGGDCPRKQWMCIEGHIVQQDACLRDAGVNTGITNEWYMHVDDGNLDIDLWSDQSEAKVAGVIVEELSCPAGSGNRTTREQNKLCASASIAETTTSTDGAATNGTASGTKAGATPGAAGTNTTSPDDAVGIDNNGTVTVTPAKTNTSANATDGESPPSLGTDGAGVDGNTTTGNTTTVPKAGATKGAAAGNDTATAEEPAAEGGKNTTATAGAGTKGVNGTDAEGATTGTKAGANATDTDGTAAKPGTKAGANATDTDATTGTKAGANSTDTDGTTAKPGTKAGANTTEPDATTGTNATEPATTDGSTPANATDTTAADNTTAVPQTTRELPASLSSAVSQQPANASDDALLSEDDSLWPAKDTEVNPKTKSREASLSYDTPVNAQSVALSGDFVKGDNVTVEVTDGANATSGPVTKTVAKNATELTIALPKDSEVNATEVKLSLPSAAKSKINSVQLAGAVPTETLTSLASTDEATGALSQWATSASDSANSPGFLGAGTNATGAPDGNAWAPENATAPTSLTLNYDTPVNASQLLLTGKFDPKTNFTAELVDGAGKATEVFSGAAPASKAASRLFPIQVPEGLTNITTAKITTEDPAGLGLDAAQLVGMPADNSTAETAAAANGTVATRGLPTSAAAATALAAGTATTRALPETFATGGSYGASTLEAGKTVDDKALGGDKADGVAGQPDGKFFQFPDSLPDGTKVADLKSDLTPWVAAEYKKPLEAVGVNVLGKATGPGTLSASVINDANKLVYLGTKDLPTGSDVESWLNFTEPSGAMTKVKKVLLTANPASSFQVDAAQLAGVTESSVSRAYKDDDDDDPLKINGHRRNGIALVTVMSILGFILCCCLLPWLLLSWRKKKAEKERLQQQQQTHYSSGTVVKNTSAAV